MKQLLCIGMLFGFLTTYAQVGIGNTNPQASLDISASSTSSPANNDGILIPRMSNFPSSPGSSRDGLLIYYTGSGASGKGFYFWNQGTGWVSISGTKNTLDQAYDEGGSGSGKNIIADNGALRINGTDGLLITGTLGNGNTIDSEITGSGIRMFFNPRTGSFRAGQVNSNKWDSGNLGDNSFAVNYDTQASGNRAFATGSATEASGLYSFTQGLSTVAAGVGSATFGINGVAPSWGEFTIGLFPTTYTVPDNWTFEPNERVFTIGNGTGTVARSNALTIYKSGLMNINDEYNMPLTDGANGQVMSTDGAGNVSFQNPIVDGNTQNTLDQAYNEGGVGAGRIISANDGSVTISGTDGFLVTGTLGSGNIIDTEVTGAGTRLFFNPNKAAFRAGTVSGTQWDDTNIGLWSMGFGANSTASGTTATAFGTGGIASGNTATAFGVDTIASGSVSTAFGNTTIASGSSATAFGVITVASGSNSFVSGSFNTAPSFVETVIGSYATEYTPVSTGAFNTADKLFVIGNGTTNVLRSNALTVYKSGLLNINDEYNMPLTDGTVGQVMITDGSGNVTFQDQTIVTDTQNTLNQSYNEGGAGVGRVITANDGAVQISGEDGFEITGTYGSGDDILLSGTGTRLFFNPKKAAFRAGHVLGSAWNNSNVGNYSFATNYNTSAEGEATFSANSYSTASGRFSASFGRFSEALSYAEMALGSYPTTYTPTNANAFNIADRAFVIGNSTTTVSRSNAFEVWKDGRVIINESYTLPTGDGTNNQVLTTDGSGNVSWQDGSSNTLALARITMSANQTFTGFNDDVKINFDTVDFDLNSNFNTTTDRFVATTAGYYRVNGNYYGTTSTVPSYFSFDIAVNGAYVRRRNIDINTAGGVTQSINSVVYLNVNDYVQLNFTHSASITINSMPHLTYFEIEQIR